METKSKNDNINRLKKFLFKKTRLSKKDRLIFGLVYAVWGTIMFTLMYINFYWSFMFAIGTLVLVILGKREIERKYVKKT